MFRPINYIHSLLKKSANHISLGKAGENAARQYLVRMGFKVLHQNWRCRSGEIDLIALKDDTLRFCEVKTLKRFPGSAYRASDKVDQQKILRIKKIAGKYLRYYEELMERLKIKYWQFDIIEVELSGFSNYSVEHLENAFE